MWAVVRLLLWALSHLRGPLTHLVSNKISLADLSLTADPVFHTPNKTTIYYITGLNSALYELQRSQSGGESDGKCNWGPVRLYRCYQQFHNLRLFGRPSQPTLLISFAVRHHTIQVRAQGALLNIIHLAKYEEHVKINVYIIYITQ